LKRRSSHAAVSALASLASLIIVSCSSDVAPGSTDREKTKPEVRALYVREAKAPKSVKAGSPVEILVRGDLPNPGYKFLRWDVHEVEGEATPTWSITPLIVYSLGAGEAVVQVVVPYEGSARFDAPATPGTLVVEIHGYSPEETIRREIAVVDQETFLELRITGGIAGISDRVTVSDDGDVKATRSIGGASAEGRFTSDEMSAIRAARDAAHLPDLNPEYITENAADLFVYQLTDFSWTPPVRVIADDMAMPHDLSPLIKLLEDEAHALFEEGGKQ
jgi:hypothetical protein